MRYAALILTAVCALAPGAASGQSMNIALIVQEVTTEICAPLMQDDDMAAAVQAALRQGYHPLEWTGGGGFDPADPPPRVVMDGRAAHIGLLTLMRGRRGQCSVDMAEATVGRIVTAAAQPLSDLGLSIVLDRSGQKPAVAVWAGDGRQAVAAPGQHARGNALTLSWDRP